MSELRARLAAPDAPIIIDVRRGPAFLEATSLLPGALRREPGDAAGWVPSLPAAGEFVVYCVHGREVSQGVAGALGARGIPARYLEG
ncbi:MAG: sulfurtransferase [Bacillota bacterium]